eukprot:2687318-Prymnesium_polylepis.1
MACRSARSRHAKHSSPASLRRRMWASTRRHHSRRDPPHPTSPPQAFSFARLVVRPAWPLPASPNPHPTLAQPSPNPP